MIRTRQDRAGALRTQRLLPLAVVAATALGGLATLAATAASRPASTAPATAPAAASARSGGVAALGRIEPLGGVVRIGAPSTPDAVSGALLVKLNVDYGDDVAAGQVLAELDTAAVVRGRLAEAQAELEAARRESVAAASLAEESCVLADVAARQSKRKTDLFGRGLVSDEEADRARGDAEAGVAACAARRAAARVADAAIATADARVGRYQAEMARAVIRAPFAGRVLDVHARPGAVIGWDGILELGRVDAMYAIAEVYETDIAAVRRGMRATVRSAALPRALSGKVERIRPKVQKMDAIGTDPAARKDARIVEVEVRLDDAAAAANLTNLQVDVEIGR